jgi:hypothetical protein
MEVGRCFAGGDFRVAGLLDLPSAPELRAAMN